LKKSIGPLTFNLFASSPDPFCSVTIDKNGKAIIKPLKSQEKIIPNDEVADFYKNIPDDVITKIPEPDENGEVWIYD
jgi:hypothetical protein